MSNEWIIDVLTDLRNYARRSGLKVTAAELENACLTALTELADHSGHGASATAGVNESEAGKPDRHVAESGVA